MRAGRARQASLSGRGAQGARARADARAAGEQGRAESRRAGGSERDRRRRGRAGRRRGRAAWARGAHGVGVPVRAGWACWLVSWASLGAQCTWLSFDSVFDRFNSVFFLSH